MPPRGASPQLVALRYLAELTRRQHELAAELDQAVADAVAAGAHWGQIGHATGRTRQGARQRWAHRLRLPRVVAHDDLLPDPGPEAPADTLPAPGTYGPLEIPGPALARAALAWQVQHDQPPEDPWPDQPPLSWYRTTRPPGETALPH